MNIALAVAALAGSTVQVNASQSEVRIVAFGTSLTARGGWTEDLQRRLARRIQRSVSLDIVALAGANSRRLAELAPSIITKQPNVVLIEQAANDAALIGGVSLTESNNNLRSLLRRVRTALPNARIIVMAMNPAIGLQRFYRCRLSKYADVHLRTAKKLGVATIDHRPAWRQLLSKGGDRQIPDGLHPTGLAARKVIVVPLANLILRELSVAGRST